MTNDPVEVHASFARNRDITYPLLADPNSEIIGAFGLINERMPRGSPWYGLAHPITFVIDANRIITHRFSSASYRDRPDPELVLKTLRTGAGG